MVPIMTAGIVLHVQILFHSELCQLFISRDKVIGRVDVEQLDRIRMGDLGEEAGAHELLDQFIITPVDVVGRVTIPQQFA